MKSAWKVEAWIRDVANSAVTRFYPTVVSKENELPLNDVYSHLLDMVDQEKLVMHWEIRCPECYTTIPEIGSYSVGEEMTCKYGHDFEITRDLIFPSFEIDPEYKASLHCDVKKKKINGRAVVHS